MKQKFRSSPPIAFESLVAEVWREYGYSVTESPESNATGLDLAATRSHPYTRVEVLCVEHSGEAGDPIENSRVQQLSALRRQEDADDVIIVTSGTLTDAAESLAANLEVHVVAGDAVFNIVHAAELYPKVEELVSVDESVTQAIHLESMAERIVMNTDTESLQAVYDTLYAFFRDHPTNPRFDENLTLEAFSESESEYEWEQSTTIRWPTNPKLNSEDIAASLVEEIPDTEAPTAELPVVAAAVELELDESLEKQPSEMSDEELATWCVEAFDESEVPMAVRTPGRAVDIAERIVNSGESVAVNKLRVAGELNRRYEESVE